MFDNHYSQRTQFCLCWAMFCLWDLCTLRYVCFRNGSALDIPFSTMPTEVFLVFSSGNYLRRGKERRAQDHAEVNKQNEEVYMWYKQLQNDSHVTCCMSMKCCHAPWLLSGRSRKQFKHLLNEGCQWEKSHKVEYMLYAFHFVFLFSHIELMYRYSRNHSAWLTLNHIGPPMSCFLKKKWNYSVGNTEKSHLKSMKAVRVLSVIAKSNSCLLLSGSPLLPVCQL